MKGGAVPKALKSDEGVSMSKFALLVLWVSLKSMGGIYALSDKGKEGSSDPCETLSRNADLGDPSKCVQNGQCDYEERLRILCEFRQAMSGTTLPMRLKKDICEAKAEKHLT